MSIARRGTFLIDMLLLGVVVIWALNFSVAKITLAQIDPMSFNGIRFLLAILFMWIILIFKGKWVAIRKEDYISLVILGLAGNFIYQLFFIFGLDRTFSANAAVMLGTMPVWVSVLSHFFYDEKMNLKKVVGVSLAFMGVILILLGKADRITLSSETFVGDLLTLASALVFAYYTVLSKKLMIYYPPMQLTTVTMTIGGLALVLTGIPWMLELNFGSISWQAYGGVFYSGILSIGVAFIIWSYGLKQVGATYTSTFQNLVPVLGLVLGFFILGEKLTLIQYIGAAVVIAGIIQTRRK
ncbi:MAG: DMT family transporter [Bacteroidota bacterium]|jgi:drug/metabolite transporter (DMT)-like permease|nr:DMT family transporter [Bacteroidota bacterium]